MCDESQEITGNWKKKYHKDNLVERITKTGETWLNLNIYPDSVF